MPICHLHFYHSSVLHSFFICPTTTIEMCVMIFLVWINNGSLLKILFCMSHRFILPRVCHFLRPGNLFPLLKAVLLLSCQLNIILKSLSPKCFIGFPRRYGWNIICHTLAPCRLFVFLSSSLSFSPKKDSGRIVLQIECYLSGTHYLKHVPWLCDIFGIGITIQQTDQSLLLISCFFTSTWRMLTRGPTFLLSHWQTGNQNELKHNQTKKH